jgi:hypothetical protein
MKLDETGLKLKEDIDIIFNGGYDDDFLSDQIEYIKQISFLYNHIDIEDNSLVFKYDNMKLKINGISELPPDFQKEHTIHLIRNSDEFKSAYTQFSRDYKIKNLL